MNHEYRVVEHGTLCWIIHNSVETNSNKRSHIRTLSTDPCQATTKFIGTQTDTNVDTLFLISTLGCTVLEFEIARHGTTIGLRTRKKVDHEERDRNQTDLKWDK